MNQIDSQELRKMKKMAKDAMIGSVHEFGKSYVHVAATSSINCLLLNEALSPEDFTKCVRFTMELLEVLYKDNRIPWETSKAELIRLGEESRAQH